MCRTGTSRVPRDTEYQAFPSERTDGEGDQAWRSTPDDTSTWLAAGSVIRVAMTLGAGTIPDPLVSNNHAHLCAGVGDRYAGLVRRCHADSGQCASLDG